MKNIATKLQERQGRRVFRGLSLLLWAIVSPLTYGLNMGWDSLSSWPFWRLWLIGFIFAAYLITGWLVKTSLLATHLLQAAPPQKQRALYLPIFFLQLIFAISFCSFGVEIYIAFL